MRGKKNNPMHKHPFTVLRITVEDTDSHPVFRKPMWLIIFGDRRDVITVKDAYDAYRQRFDAEHFFRFRKNKLLIDSCSNRTDLNFLSFHTKRRPQQLKGLST